MFKHATIVLASALLFGCGGIDSEVENDEIITNLVEAGFPADDIMISDGLVYVGRDAHVTLEASREMLQVGSDGKEQYRTTNVVGTTITKICIVPTSSFASYSMLSQGLDLAIQNYNNLGLQFTFVRGNPGGCSATISAKITGGTSSSAGFPSGGLPYNTINIGTGLQNYTLDANEHVISHELGHAIGLRHSDYYNRSISCGSGGDEGATDVGAIHIPGTPTTATLFGSVMNSCWRPTETGEFTSSDITALTTVY